MTIRLPNFLLVGAPKCGTTSIASYLAQHPDIYISPIKEPKFFTAQFLRFPLQGPGDSFVENFTVKTFDAYTRLFHRINHEKAIGDASADNLYFHEQVIPLIKRCLGDVKIVIVLRNPVERAFSAYKNLLRDSRETLSFEEGLDLEKDRRERGYEYIWRYLDLGFYHEQVRAYLEAFSRVKVIILEQFQNGEPALMQQIYDFLEVDASFRPRRRSQFNVSGKPRFRWAQRPFNPTGLKGKAYKLLAMNGFDVDSLMRWVEPVRNANLQPVAMDPKTRQRLHGIYAADIDKLADLLQTDLNPWVRTNDPAGSGCLTRMPTTECLASSETTATTVSQGRQRRNDAKGSCVTHLSWTLSRRGSFSRRKSWCFQETEVPKLELGNQRTIE